MGGSMMLGGIIFLGVWKTGDQFFSNLLGWFKQGNSTPQVDVRSVVVKQVQDASELTTAIFTMEAIVPTKQDANLGGFVLGTTKLLYVAYGQVRAGVDLSQIKPANIQVQGDQLNIQLPAPQLLDSKIDVSRSNVYDYNRGFLGLGPDAAPTLQTLAQKKALERIVDAACREGILQKANDRAKLVVSQLVKVPTAKTVTVQLTPPAACQVATPNPTAGNSAPPASPTATQIAPSPLAPSRPRLTPSPTAPSPTLQVPVLPPST
ncbi:DUF4230 domain-containing protein [filamentous cyanobacterium LEGE 11480]|uniref:DUF4230 domain-containing protein n=2 Tax=Romeriopsis TaxID=2992131 RepID=A0A928Z2Y2_9CYAN|nr:DUF4230 domain-containing protein [Romeriopsis navalis LEGE 11480]